jgi:hypothetical protein
MTCEQISFLVTPDKDGERESAPEAKFQTSFSASRKTRVEFVLLGMRSFIPKRSGIREASYSAGSFGAAGKNIWISMWKKPSITFH